MKILRLAPVILTSTTLLAQKSSYDNYEKYFPTANQLKYTIYSVEYKEGKNRLDAFVKQKAFVIINVNETKNAYHYEFQIYENEIASIDSMCNRLGYVSSRNLNSYNNEKRLAETTLELERLELKKSEYEKMLQKIDSVKSEKYYSHWEKIREIETDIFETRKKIKQLEAVKNRYTVTINLNDEQSSPSSSKVNFVHMPGAEYVYLFTENSKPGISYDSYQGVFLKYLFTKGKSYFSLGALKANNPNKADSLAYDEVFCFVFGQDWYSRHFGRGNNKFGNLYIGYQAGMALGYNSKIAKGIPFVCPTTGIELFKNKYLLIDSNVNYYLPVTEENRNMRGWRLGASVNFSF